MEDLLRRYTVREVVLVSPYTMIALTTRADLDPLGEGTDEYDALL